MPRSSTATTCRSTAGYHPGAFEESWRLEDPHGLVVYEGVPRNVLAEHGDLSDEVQRVRFDYADQNYQLVLEVDGREVARVSFDVQPPAGPASPSS